MRPAYAKNPGELAILSNPDKGASTNSGKTRITKTNKSMSSMSTRKNKKGGTRSNKSRSNPRKNAQKTLMSQFYPAAAVVLGQVGATQLTKVILGTFGKDLSELFQRLLSVGVPTAAALATVSFFQKNQMTTSAAVGMSTTALLATVRWIVPDFHSVPVANELSGSLKDPYGDKHSGHLAGGTYVGNDGSIRDSKGNTLYSPKKHKSLPDSSGAGAASGHLADDEESRHLHDSEAQVEML